MKGARIYILLLALITLCGLWMRVRDLDYRPMHHDEANQALKFGALLEKGTYEYDATDHHGPSMYYLTLPLAWARGQEDISEMTETSLRMLQVIFGSALIILLYLFRDALGGPAMLYAGALTALSPVMNYYSRFYIQEIILVFFTFASVACGWRYKVTGRPSWAILAGLAVGLMYATKETAVLAWMSCFLALVIAWAVMGASRKALHGITPRHVTYGIAAALFLAFFFFSSFFTNMRGPVDSVLAYFSYILKAGGSDTSHVHPWYFYLRRVAWYDVSPLPAWTEWVVCLFGAVGIGYALLPGRDKVEGDRGAVLFTAIYTLCMTVIYSSISYKTPWCVLSLYHGLIIMAGYGMAVAVRISQKWYLRVPVYAVIILGCVHLAFESERTNHRFCADHRNPWVYAQTSMPYYKLVKLIDGVAAVSGEGKDIFIAVIAPPDKTWPLPWSLRKYRKVGFWPELTAYPRGYQPAIVISSEESSEELDRLLSEGYQRGFYGLRYDVMLATYVRNDLWEAYIDTAR